MEHFLLKSADLLDANIFLSVLIIVAGVILFVLLQRINTLAKMIQKNAKDQSEKTTFLTNKVSVIEEEGDKQLMALNHILTTQPTVSTEVQPKLFQLPKAIPQGEVLFQKVDLPAATTQRQNIIVSAAGSAIPHTVLDAYTRSAAKGLYEATAPIEKLMRYNDGTLSSIVVEKGGRIQAHSGFEQAGGIWTPAVVFQLLSMVTAQYYLNGITKQLNEIGSKLKVLIHLHHNEKISKLQADYERLSELSRKSHYELEDLVEIRACINSAYSIHREYSNLMQKTSIKELRKTIKEAMLESSSEHLAKLNEIYGEAKFNANLLVFSRRVLFSAKLIELKANVYISKRAPERTHNIPHIVDDLQEIMREYNAPNSNLTEKIDELLSEHSHAALEIKNDAWLASNEAQAKRQAKTYAAETSEVTHELSVLAKDVEKTYKKIKHEITRDKKMYILVDKDGVQHPLIPEDKDSGIMTTKEDNQQEELDQALSESSDDAEETEDSQDEEEDRYAEARLVQKVGLKREAGFIYFLDNDGDIARARKASKNKPGGKLEKVIRLGIEREDGFLYYIDKQGDISRAIKL